MAILSGCSGCGMSGCIESYQEQGYTYDEAREECEAGRVYRR